MDPSLPLGLEAPFVKLETGGSGWAPGATLRLCRAWAPVRAGPGRGCSGVLQFMGARIRVVSGENSQEANASVQG